jgi:hypothetical protein
MWWLVVEAWVVLPHQALVVGEGAEAAMAVGQRGAGVVDMAVVMAVGKAEEVGVGQPAVMVGERAGGVVNRPRVVGGMATTVGAMCTAVVVGEVTEARVAGSTSGEAVALIAMAAVTRGAVVVAGGDGPTVCR